MQKFFLLSGSFLGLLSVAIGAFGAHALKATLEANQRLDTFELAVKYQFYHALALLGIGILANQFKTNAFDTAGYTFIAGVLIFSGSLYILSLTNMRWLGAVTPIGGTAFLVGWIALMWAVWQAK
jgi:uncharacterized membrane protein YgdD (TMEM256/DUF423 family)